MRSIYLLSASEQGQHAVAPGQVALFSALPMKRKEIRQLKEIELSLDEWQGREELKALAG